MKHGKATNSMRPINQRGIVIGPILFIVAILAVLASAIAAGSGAFNGDISAVSAKAQAAAILEQANEIKLGVDRVLGKGCTDTQVSFENPIVSGYENPNAPSDKSCHVFDVNGGGVVWKEPPKDAVYTLGLTQGRYAFVENIVENTGSNNGDLVILLSIQQNIASVLAPMLGQTGIPESSGAHNGSNTSFSKFVGTFYDSSSVGSIGGNVPPIKLNSAGVFCDIAGVCTPSASYYFYQVLIVR